jgi:hypothetical protein
MLVTRICNRSILVIVLNFTGYIWKETFSICFPCKPYNTCKATFSQWFTLVAHILVMADTQISCLTASPMSMFKDKVQNIKKYDY